MTDSFYLVHSTFMGENHAYIGLFFCCFFLHDFVKKPNQPLAVDLYSDVYRPISVKLGMMLKTIQLYILISVLMALTFNQGDLFKKKEIKNIHFFVDLSIEYDEI